MLRPDAAARSVQGLRRDGFRFCQVPGGRGGLREEAALLRFGEAACGTDEETGFPLTSLKGFCSSSLGFPWVGKLRQSRRCQSLAQRCHGAGRHGVEMPGGSDPTLGPAETSSPSLVALSLVMTWTAATSISSSPRMVATRYPFTTQ